MAHIAIDARIINSSTGTYVERLLHYLQQVDQTNKYTVLVRAKDMSYWTPTNLNFTVQIAEYDNYSLAEQLGFKSFLNKLAPDLIHFCMPQQPVLYRGKSVTTFHDLTLVKTYNRDKNWLIYHAKQLVGRYVFRRVARKSQAIICPSRYTADELARFTHIDPSKISVIYEACEVEKTNLAPYEHPFKQFILYVGQQPTYKNITRLGDAHQKLLETHPDLGLILVGRKNAGVKLNERYFASKNYRNILFTDFLPDQQRDWLYSQAGAYVFPSLMEGFGLPGLEAMAQGAPVVSSSATCLPEIYGAAAVYFDPLNTDDIAAKIASVIDNESLRQQLQERAQEQLKHYSWRTMAEETLAVYKRVLENI